MKPSLHSVLIIVADIQASIKFYRTLGLDVPDANPDDTHIDCIMEGSVYICLVPEATAKKHRDGWQGSAGNRLTLQFRCETQNDVDVTYTKLINEEYTSSELPHDTPWGERYAQVLDPDGNVIVLFAGLGT